MEYFYLHMKYKHKIFLNANIPKYFTYNCRVIFILNKYYLDNHIYYTMILTLFSLIYEEIIKCC